MSTLVWFRKDLRMHDNPALCEACKRGKPILAIYIDDLEDPKPMGAASRWFAHKAMQSLQRSLADLHIPMIYRQGKPLTILHELCHQYNIDHVLWNRLYTQHARTRDELIKESLKKSGIGAHSFNGYLLFEPWQVKTLKDTHFQVFTPFWKQCLQSPEPDKPVGRLSSQPLPAFTMESRPWDDIPAELWHHKLEPHWVYTEDEVQKLWHNFCESALNDYATNRDLPAVRQGTSRLSAYLHHGLISIHRVWHDVAQLQRIDAKPKAKFLAELGWREFSYHLLYSFPDLPWRNFNPRFDAFPWTHDHDLFQKWSHGETGIPIVDAGMRELWETGWMHNRVRMIVASFLTKHLLIDWRAGEEWFWDTLVDADPASNAASWQWVAGCGADAAPYFRVFNPLLQSSKFDSQGDYIRTYLPKLSHLGSEHIHQAWLYDKSLPKPIVDVNEGRNRALAAYERNKLAQA